MHTIWTGIIFFLWACSHSPLDTSWSLKEQIFLFSHTLFFNWRIIALQCYVGFCHTTMWIGHVYTYITPCWASFPPHPHPSSLGHHSTELCSLCYIAASYYLSILHMVMYIYQCYSLNLSHPLCSLHDLSLLSAYFYFWI